MTRHSLDLPHVNAPAAGAQNDRLAAAVDRTFETVPGDRPNHGHGQVAADAAAGGWGAEVEGGALRPPNGDPPAGGLQLLSLGRGRGKTRRYGPAGSRAAN